MANNLSSFDSGCCLKAMLVIVSEKSSQENWEVGTKGAARSCWGEVGALDYIQVVLCSGGGAGGGRPGLHTSVFCCVVEVLGRGHDYTQLE